MAYVKKLDHSALSGYTVEALYWMGILATDGNVCMQKKGKNPTIAYGCIDLEHVVKFKEFLKSDSKICIAEPRLTNFGMSKQVAMLRVTSAEIGAVLAENGIRIRKSLTLRVSDRLTVSRDFWRGAIDGDGNIGTNTKGCPRLYLTSGSPEFIEQYCIFCEVHGLKKRPIVYPAKGLKSPCYRAESYGSNACALLEVLYADSAVSLDAKRSAAENILEKSRPGVRETRALAVAA